MGTNYGKSRFRINLWLLPIWLFVGLPTLAQDQDLPLYRIGDTPLSQQAPLPLVRFSEGFTGIWWPEKNLVLIEARHWPKGKKDNPQATLPLYQIAWPVGSDTLSESSTLRLTQDLSAGLPQMPGTQQRIYQDPSGASMDLTVAVQINDWQVVRLWPQWGLVGLSSRDLAKWQNEIPGWPAVAQKVPDTLWLVGFASTSHFSESAASRTHHWLRRVPFRRALQDSLRVPLPPAPAIPTDYFYQGDQTAYQKLWPGTRTRIVLEVLTDHGHPLLQLTQWVEAARKRSARQPLPADLVAYTDSLFRLPFDQVETFFEPTELARTLRLYYTQVYGPVIPKWLVEQARIYQKDYYRMAEALLRKGRFANPDAWLNGYSEDPEGTLKKLAQDYTFRFFRTLLYRTLEQEDRLFGASRTQQKRMEQQSHRSELDLTNRRANGSLRLSRWVRGSEKWTGTITPGFSGGALLTKEGALSGILLSCPEEEDWGSWHAPTEVTCSRIIPWSEVLRTLRD